MAFPADLDTIVVRHKITDAAGKPLKGNTVTAEPAERVWATDGSIVQYRAATQIDADGQWELELPYVDQEGIRNKGVPWRVTEHVPGQPKSYFVAPVLAHGAGPIDAAECLVSAPTSRETVIQAGPVTDEAAASLLAQDGEFKAALMDTIGAEVEQQVPAKVTEALAADDAPAQAAAAAVTAELVEGEAGRHFGARATADAPATPPPPRPRVTWLTTFQPGHGWTNPLLYGAITDDDGTKMMGTQSLLLDATGDSASAAQRAIALDLSDKMLALWVRVEDITKVTQLFVYASNSSSLSNSYVWTVTRGSDGSPWFQSGEWAFVTLPWPSTNVLGTAPDRSALTHLRVRVNGTDSRVWLNAIGTVPVERPSGVVSITFDDGYASVIEAARRSMTPRGLTGTAYIIPQYIDAPSGNFMTEADLRELRDVHGWDIESHGPTNYTTMTPEQMRAEWSATKRWIAERGLGRGDHLAYVGGQNNPDVVRTAREFFTTARTIAGRMAESLPPAMPHRLRALSSISGADGGTSIATVKDAIDAAADTGHWCILTFHRIVEGTPTNTNDCSWADFDDILDHIVTSGVEVLTVDQAARI